MVFWRLGAYLALYTLCKFIEYVTQEAAENYKLQGYDHLKSSVHMYITISKLIPYFVRSLINFVLVPFR